MRISDWSSDVCSSDLPDEDAWPADGRVGHRQPDAEEQGIGEKHEQDRRRRQHEPEGDEVAVAHEPRPPAGPADRRGLFNNLGVRDHALCPQSSFSSYRDRRARSEEHTSELQSLMRISYAVFCLNKKKNTKS